MNKHASRNKKTHSLEPELVGEEREYIYVFQGDLKCGASRPRVFAVCDTYTRVRVFLLAEAWLFSRSTDAASERLMMVCGALCVVASRLANNFAAPSARFFLGLEV